MQAEEKWARISCSDCQYSHIDTLLTKICGAADHKFFTLLLTRNQFVKLVSQSGRKTSCSDTVCQSLTTWRQTTEAFWVSSGKRRRRLESGRLSRDRQLKLLFKTQKSSASVTEFHLWLNLSQFGLKNTRQKYLTTSFGLIKALPPSFGWVKDCFVYSGFSIFSHLFWLKMQTHLQHTR